jgi:hypothetical protein
MYENGISAYIYIDAVEGEQYKGHYLIITYFIPNLNLFVENKDDKKEILKFIKQEVGKNDYTLDYFFNEAFEIAINHVDESSKKENNGFRMFAVNPDWASELEVRVLEIRDSQYVVNIYYNISL